MVNIKYNVNNCIHMCTENGMLVSARITPRSKEALDKMVSKGIALNRSDAIRIALNSAFGIVEDPVVTQE